MATIKLAILRSKPDKRGMYKVRIAVGHRQQTTYILTPVSVSADEWDGTSVVRRHDAAALNIELTQQLLEYRRRLQSVQSIERLTCQQLRDVLVSMRSHSEVFFLSAVDEYLGELLLDGRKGTHTLTSHAASLFIDYLHGDFPLSSLTPTHIASFERELRRKGLSDTTIGMYMVSIRTLVNRAVRLQQVRYDVHPFLLWRRPQAPVRELDISVGDMRRLIAYTPTTEREAQAKDFFLLSYYLAGINLADLLTCRLSGERLEYVRKKSSRTKHGDVMTSFTIQPEARVVLSRWVGKDGRIMCDKSVAAVRDRVNKALKQIADNIGINGRFCYYSARKSFVQHGFDLGVPLEVLEYCIGQSVKRNRPIFNYVKVMRRHADEAIRKILDNVKREGS